MHESSFGPVIIDVEGKYLANNDRELLSHSLVGGIILFTRNYESREQLQALVSEIRQLDPSLLICVDHEGGRVQRFREGFTRIPSMQLLGDYWLSQGQSDEALMTIKDVGWLLAAELIACGIDISFTPVLDLDRDRSSIIGDRAFSDDPELCSVLAGALIEGLHDAGMASTGKHFPGHGSIVADSHLELPVDDREWATIETHDVIPFRNLSSQLDAVMPAHVLYPKVDADNPAGFSPYWLQEILRKQLGFDGVIFSDDLSMAGAAETGDIFARADAAIAAGCDSVLVCNDRESADKLLSRWQPQWPEAVADKSRDRLARMKAKQVISWIQLEQSDRYRKTREYIQSLMA